MALKFRIMKWSAIIVLSSSIVLLLLKAKAGRWRQICWTLPSASWHQKFLQTVFVFKSKFKYGFETENWVGTPSTASWKAKGKGFGGWWGEVTVCLLLIFQNTLKAGKFGIVLFHSQCRWLAGGLARPGPTLPGSLAQWQGRLAARGNQNTIGSGILRLHFNDFL